MTLYEVGFVAALSFALSLTGCGGGGGNLEGQPCSAVDFTGFRCIENGGWDWDWWQGSSDYGVQENTPKKPPYTYFACTLEGTWTHVARCDSLCPDVTRAQQAFSCRP
jgi:hypothetical protein